MHYRKVKSMKELKEYSQYSDWSPTSGDQLRLFELAIAGASRENAREVLDISSNHFNVIYKKLKDNFAQGILTSQLNGIPNSTKIRYNIRKQYTTATLLLRSEKKAAGIPLARAAMRKALKFNMFPIALDLSRDLRRYYGLSVNNKKLYEYYSEKQQYILNEMRLELEAEDVFIRLGYSLKKGLPSDEIIEKLNWLSSQNADGYNFHYMRWLSKTIYLQAIGKEEEMLEACRSALKFFETYKDKDLPYIVKFSFYYRAIAILIARREFKQAEVLINRGLDDTATGRRNWQIIMLHRSILGFHSEKPAIAFATWNKVGQVPAKQQPEEFKQRWLVVEAYLSLMDFDLPQKFRLRRFLNSVPMLESDKSGQNINIILLELLHLLKARKLRDFDDRVDQLDKYIHQHLRGKNRHRCVNFLRMLQCVQRGGYRKVAVERKARPYLANLEKTVPNISANAVELVPFKVLWEMALGWLK